MSRPISVKKAGQRGGLQRARNLSRAERTEIARMGGLARQQKRKEDEENLVDTTAAKR